MTLDKTTRRVYSAEKLYRLRGTCSQPKLREAIEEHDGEDAELVKGEFATACTTVSESWHRNTTARANRDPSHIDINTSCSYLYLIMVATFIGEDGGLTQL